MLALHKTSHKSFETAISEPIQSKIMKHSSVQNSPNELDSSEQLETRDRLSLRRPEEVGTYSVKTPCVKPDEVAINTDINAESLSAQIPEDITLMQVASPLPKVETRIDETILQKRPNQSPQEDCKNPNNAGIAVVQNFDIDNTILQYSDSAIHNPAEQTVCQTKMACSLDFDETVCQLKKPQFSQSSALATVQKNQAPIQLFHPSIFRDMFRASGSFASRFVSTTAQFLHSIGRKIDPRQLQSRFHQDRQQAVLKTSAQTSLSSIASEEQPSSEQYQKKQRELDYCRLSFAKELARNGKFRVAIAMAEQISQTSLFFKDAQKLIQSWKQI
jgi:hypothetical protein